MLYLNDPNNLREIINYMQSINLDSNKRWIDVSQKFNDFNQYILVTIQGLGKLDSKLVIEDDNWIKYQKSSNPFDDGSDHLTLSYLWVLGAYEIIRSLCQKGREDSTFFPHYQNEMRGLRTDFERLRIPLAKFEPAKKFSNTDFPIAFPGFNFDKGISWKISDNIWISRRTLSDNMLTLFEKM